MLSASHFKETCLFLTVICISVFLSITHAENTPKNSDSTVKGASEVISLPRQYTNESGKYSIKYPENWIVDDSDVGTVILSGKKDTAEYFTTINIQTILGKKLGGDYNTVADIVKDIKDQIRDESMTVTYLVDHNYELTSVDGEKMSGYEMVFIYSYQGHIIEQWQIILSRKKSNVFYTWAYTAPIEDYGQVLPIAKAMNQTWMIR